MTPLKLVGDGLAGTFLAAHLAESGIPFEQFGDGKTNNPPVAFVHLFQGRTFHRNPLEVEAFRQAVKFWREAPDAKQWSVRRTVSAGDRLERSAHTDTVPAEYAPKKVAPETYCYEPGFTIDTHALTTRLRERSPTIHRSRVDLAELSRTQILATGLAVQEVLADLPWDTNPGRTVNAHCPGSPTLGPSQLHLHRGCHLGTNPLTDGFTIGGRVNSKGEAKNDEAEIAATLLGEPVEVRSQWWGERIANALDRQPMIGWLDEKRFLFAGFGGRALFWLPYCSAVAVQALQARSNEAIPELLRADRFTKR